MKGVASGRQGGALIREGGREGRPEKPPDRCEGIGALAELNNLRTQPIGAGRKDDRDRKEDQPSASPHPGTSWTAHGSFPPPSS